MLFGLSLCVKTACPRSHLHIAGAAALLGRDVARHAHFDGHLGLDGAVVEDDLERAALGNERRLPILQVTHVEQVLLQTTNVLFIHGEQFTVLSVCWFTAQTVGTRHQILR